MASVEEKSKREFKSMALKKLDDIFQDSLMEIDEIEALFDLELDGGANRGFDFEFTYELKSVQNLLKSIRDQVSEIQESLTVCDGIFSTACDNRTSQEDVLTSLQQLHINMDFTSTSLIAEEDVDVARLNLTCLESKRATRRRAHRRRQGNICRHHCRYHQEVMDNMLWRKVPQEVVQHVCAFLPLSKTMQLLELIKPWSKMPSATNFRQSCAHAHPKLFGLFLYNNALEQWNLFTFDFKLGNWLQLSLPSIISDNIHVDWALRFNDLPLYGHDYGLICLSTSRRLASWLEDRWILVYNPLTGDEKYLPLPKSLLEGSWAILLQLLVDAKTGSYKLNLVSQRDKKSYQAESYDSNSQKWSTLGFGYVYGSGILGIHYEPIIFDCASKRICEELPYQASLKVQDYVFVRDHCLLLHRDGEERTRDLCYRVSESVRENGWSLESTTNVMFHGNPLALFASERYLLVIRENGTLMLHDRETHEQVMINNLLQFLTLEDLLHDIKFICDLNWVAAP